MITFKNLERIQKSLAHFTAKYKLKLTKFEALKKCFIKYYLTCFEPLGKFCVLLSIINQVLVMNVLENKKEHDDGVYETIDFFFNLEFIIAYLMTADCFFKVWLYEFFLEDQSYGIIYLLIDCISGPVGLGHDMYFLVFMGQYSIIGFLMRFSKIFTFNGIRKILRKLKKMTSTIFPLFFTLFSIFYIFSYLAKSMYNRDAPQYFGSLSDSMFTMFQILTLDSWGVIGRSILKLNGMISALYLAVFVFIMTYFFLNILIGFIVDNMSSTEDEKNNNKQTHLHSQNEPEGKNLFFELIIGKYYDIIVFICFGLSLFEVYTFVNSSPLEGTSKYFVRFFAMILEFSSGVFFSLHFFAIVYLKRNYGKEKMFKNHSNLEGIFFIIHMFAGPLALSCDIYQYLNYSYIKYGHFLRILKILSIGSNRKFILTYFKIIPKLLNTFATLMGVVILLAFWATEKLRYILPEYFGNLNLSVYSFIQILTMDDWCAGITRKLLRNAEESALPFVFFIFFANYILLNIMLAISCDQMKEVSHHQTIFEGECDSLSSFSSKTNDYKEFTTKNSLKTILSNLLKLIEFKHAFFYSKLIKNVKLKEFLAKKIISDNENEISLYFLLKEINRKNKTNIQENEKDLDVFIIEYKGKIVKTTQKKVMIRINKNVEFLIHSKHISYAEKQKKNMRFDIMNLTKSKFFLDKNNEEDIGNELEKLIK